MNKRNSALRKLQMLDFAIIEVSLYLDAYPTCAKALSYQRQLKNMRDKEYREFERDFGPLTIYSELEPNYNNYVNDPWPWEGE